MSHNYIFWTTFNYEKSIYSLLYLDIITLTSEEEESKRSYGTLYNSEVPFQITKMDDQYLGLLEKGKANLVTVYPACYFDQYLDSAGKCA